MQRMILVVALILATLCSTVALASDGPSAEKATVVSMAVKRPPRLVHRHAHLALPARPTPAQVRRAINREAAMWGVPAVSLSRRVACESHYQWWASNGQYEGVLQFAPGTFYRGWRTIRTRKVIEVDVRQRRMHSRVYRQWSDGRITRSRGRIVRQTVVVTRRGTIPKFPAANNTDAQLRIGAQAIRGISAVHSSEWSCGA